MTKYKSNQVLVLSSEEEYLPLECGGLAGVHSGGGVRLWGPGVAVGHVAHHCVCCLAVRPLKICVVFFFV